MMGMRWMWLGVAGLAVACEGGSSGTGTSVGTLGGLTTVGGGTDTDASTGPTAGTSGVSQTSGSTAPTGVADTGTDSCICEPGEAIGCVGTAVEVCADDCLSTREESCVVPEECVGGTCQLVGCMPGSTQCAPDGSGVQTCDGFAEWGPGVPCPAAEECYGGACVSLCDLAAATPSSQGCSFRANNMQTYSQFTEPSALVVGNTSEVLTAQLQMYLVQAGAEVAQGGPVSLAPGATHTFTLTQAKMGLGSVLRSGGSYRLESDVPVIAYQHSPVGAQADNDASMILPDNAAGDEFLISSYTPNIPGDPSYFNVIALDDATLVQWTPPVATPAGTGVPAVAANATGMVTMNAGDTLQVAVYADLTGTRVTSDNPVWVVGAMTCVQVPTGVTACDHLEEQQIPLEYWGEEYVAAHAPARGSEDYHWRVFAGDDGVLISTDPVLPGFPTTLNDGEWFEFTSTDSFVMTADGPFMPVQYIESQSGGAGTGDPAMVQMVPVEQFLDRYAFVTGTGYDVHYVQITRDLGGADVLVDGVVVDGYYTVGSYEVADWPISEGSHLAQSDDSFGIMSVGYTGFTSYAYPGGLELEVINPG
ncbi:MAG: IgGFc-binding protein [Nannocystales bacterium]